MRFGVFVPQGWRLDLTGIEPAAQWTAMLDVARAAEASLFESIWVYDHFHTMPIPTDEATWPASDSPSHRLFPGLPFVMSTETLEIASVEVR